MLSKTILALTTFVLAVSASPMANPVSGLSKRNTPVQNAQQQCGDNLQASCCNSVTNQIWDLVPISVGSGCTALNLLAVDALNELCPQTVACCQTTGNQNGLINIGTVCPQIVA